MIEVGVSVQLVTDSLFTKRSHPKPFDYER